MAALKAKVTVGGVEFTGRASPLSSSKKARMSRRKRFGHRAALRSSKQVHFPGWFYNIMLGMLQRVEKNDPRQYIYPYEYLGEVLLGIQRQHPEIVRMVAAAVPKKKGGADGGNR
jgi:hypothetical protein